MSNNRFLKQILLLAFVGLASLVNAQTIELEKIKLNGTIGYSMTLDELKSSNIQIDSIRAIPELMDMSMADSLVYIGGSYFEYFKNTNKCYLNVIKFDERVNEVRIGDLILNNKTTVEHIQAIFQDDCQTIQNINIYQELKPYTTCGIPLSVNGILTDSKLLFFFLEGKLSRINIWDPS
tara:strand:+ start:278 stop:814 length:537 start_codon:yes stop_codon:yes gene_type:complete